MPTALMTDSLLQSLSGLMRRLDQFDRAWQDAIAPDLPSFLSQTLCLDDTWRRHLLEELVKIDLEYRWQPGGERKIRAHLAASGHGLPPRPVLECYLHLYPELRADTDGLVELIGEEYRVRRRWGDAPAADSYADRFPDVAAQLSDRFLQIDAELARDACFQPTDEATDHDLLPCLPGTVLGEYEILAEIGKGGMGRVFRARHVKTRNIVALKMIRTPALAGAAEVERFAREIELHQRLDHPHILPIYHVGEHAGQSFFTMKLVEAGSLKVRLDKVQLSDRSGRGRGRGFRRRAVVAQSARRIARLVARTADAVHHAHQHRLLHRDLKPANILLQGTDHPYVADFGLVLPIDEAGDSNRPEGTLPYMAPEQAEGSAPLSTAVDVYGLGAILYELLTGRPPHTGESKDEILEKVRKQPVNPPWQIQPLVPRELGLICLKCLERDPKKRYNSARDVAKALDHFVEGKTIPGVPTSRWRRGVKWVRRKPAMAGLIALFLAALCLGAGMVVQQFRAAREAQRQAEQRLYWRSIPEAGNALAAGDRGRTEEILNECPAHLRDLEWHLLKRACEPDLTLSPLGGGAAVTSGLADGRIIAAGGRSGTVALYDATTGEQHQVVVEGAGAIVGLVSGGQGRYLAAAGADELTVWEVMADAATKDKAGTVVRRVKTFAAGKLVALARDVGRVAAIGTDGNVNVWALPAGELVCSVKYLGFVHCLALSPDGRWLALGCGMTGDACPLQVWDLATGKQRAPDRCEINVKSREQVYSVAWGGSGEHERLVAASASQARIWDIATGKQSSLPAYETWATSLALDPGGRYLAAGFTSGAVRVFALDEENKVVFSARRGPGSVNSLCFDAMARQILSASGGQVTAERWRERGGVRTLRGSRVAFANDGASLAVAESDGHVDLLDSVTLKGKGRRWRAHERSITAMVYNPSNTTQLATASTDDTVRIWDLDKGKQILRIHATATHLAFSTDGTKLAGACGEEAKVWCTSTGKELTGGVAHAAEVHGVAFKPNADMLATACGDWAVSVWDLTNMKQIILDKHLLSAAAVVFSADGSLLASASDDAKVNIWKIGAEMRRAPVHTLAHPVGVVSAAFTPDGKRLVTVARDGRVRFWATETGQELLNLSRSGKAGIHQAHVAMNPVPESRQLALAIQDEVIEIWDGVLQGALRP